MGSNITPFSFVGQLNASKSQMNRALICKSFFAHLEILGRSDAEDVQKMTEAIKVLETQTEFDCGSAGTVMRFLALRLARQKGRYVLHGSDRLLRRLLEPLRRVLGQLGAETEVIPGGLILKAHGWKMVGDAMHVPTDQSSQFASGLLLSAWNLDFPLYMLLSEKGVSESYLNLTIQMVRKLGMKVETVGREIRVPQGQQLKASVIEIEPDMSSMFSLVAAAVVNGQARLTGWPETSLQPDSQFVDLLKAMGADLKINEKYLSARKTSVLKNLSADLTQAPDLFPSLAVLCSLAEGESFLAGATQLIYKESNRLEKTVELIRASGREVMVHPDGVKIQGQKKLTSLTPWSFDPDQDHRMAMAASLYLLNGEPVTILNPDVVNKSFRDYWERIGVQP